MSDPYKTGWRQGVRDAIIEVESLDSDLIRNTAGPVLRRLLASGITPATGNYVRITPEHGDVMTREQWLDSVRQHFFIDYDGHGLAMRDGKIDVKPILPSQADQLPEDATHVVWFNK